MADEKEKGDAFFDPVPLPNNDGNIPKNIDIDVFKVGIRVPPFWVEEPEIWFAQLEGQFALNGISSDATKFYYVTGNLGPEASREVKDILIKPPLTDKYEKLKSELIKRLSASQEKKIQQLLMHEEIGDRKPSQFLRHLQSLAGSDCPGGFLKTIWMSRMSHPIQTVLAGKSTETPVEELADLADRVSEIAPQTHRVASLHQPGPSSAMSDLAKEVAELRNELRKLSVERQRRSPARGSHDGGRSRSRGRSNSRSRRSSSNHRKHPLCWYHFRWGEKASKCIQPCDYSAGNAKGSL